MKIEVLDSYITFKGYGQYSIKVELLIDNNLKLKKSFHCTDSELYDSRKEENFEKRLINYLGGLDNIVRDVEFTVQIRRNKSEIETFTLLEEAKDFIKSKELEDTLNGEFVENYYEIRLSNY